MLYSLLNYSRKKIKGDGVDDMEHPGVSKKQHPEFPGVHY